MGAVATASPADPVAANTTPGAPDPRPDLLLLARRVEILRKAAVADRRERAEHATEIGALRAEIAELREALDGPAPDRPTKLTEEERRRWSDLITAGRDQFGRELFRRYVTEGRTPWRATAIKHWQSKTGGAPVELEAILAGEMTR